MVAANEALAALQAEYAALQQENQRLREQVAASNEHPPHDKALHASEQRYRLLIESMQDGVFLAQDGKLVFVNEQLATMVGYSVADLLQRSIIDVIAPEDRDMVLDRHRRRMQGETISNHYDFRMLRRDGQRRWGHMIVGVVHYEGKEATMGTVRDISTQKQQDEELRIFRFAVENISDGVQLLQHDGYHRYVNDALCRHLGYTRDELLQLSLDQIDPDIDMEVWRQELWPMIKAQGSVNFEARHRRKDGSIIPVEVTGNHIAFGDEEYLFAFVRDISERKQNEEHMRVLSALADNALDGVALASLDAVITYANPAFQRMSGHECVGTPIIELYPPQGRAQIEQEVVPALMQEGSWQGVIEMQRPDGSRWLAQHSAFVIRSESGEALRMGNILHDVTEQRRLEQDHAALQQQIIDAQRAALRELSTPLIPVSDKVVIMPLIGTIDTGRAQQVMETLLEGVAHHQATLAILDITGVSIVDTQVAQALVGAAQAVRLLGAQVMLTGIQPQIAQTLVHLGVDLSSIETRGSLESGIAEALRHQAR
jgi:rsbT co-antagonist protein RsbR